MFLVLYIIGGIAFICWMFSKFDGTEMNNGLGSFFVLVFVTLIYSLVWPIIWPITYFSTKDSTGKQSHSKNPTPSITVIPINSDDELIVNYSDSRAVPTTKNDIKNIVQKNAENITPTKLPKNNITETKINDANLKTIDDSKKSVAKADKPIKSSGLGSKISKEVKKLPKGSTPTAYQCLKCFYKWNRDPNLRCAMCSDSGPYKPHDGLPG
jgi:hypothetical protein